MEEAAPLRPNLPLVFGLDLAESGSDFGRHPGKFKFGDWVESRKNSRRLAVELAPQKLSKAYGFWTGWLRVRASPPIFWPPAFSRVGSVTE